jgi:RNA polymerase sigma factor (sigma-70 family)
MSLIGMRLDWNPRKGFAAMEAGMPSHSSGSEFVPHGRGEGVLAVERLSVNDLARSCAAETQKFLHQSASDDRYCLELFRRAIVGRDDDAWACLYQQYAPLVLTWVNQHQSATALLGQEGSAPLVNAVFAKFAQALTPAKMANFTSLAALLKYLKMCVHSVIADEIRARQSRQYEETLDAIEQEPASDDPAEDVISGLSMQHLWQVIQEELNGEDERLLIYLAYVQGMKPAEICAQQRHHFTTVEDVYRVKRNVLERLRRNQRLLALLKHRH